MLRKTDMLRMIAAGALLAAAWGQPQASAQAQVTITLSCSALGIEMALCRDGAERWAEATGNSVALVATPPDAGERLALYQTLLAAGSADIDVFQIDVVWPGILAAHLIDLADHIPAGERASHLDVLIENNTVDGRLVAAPWFVDAGLLYYRADLLEEHGFDVPESWAALTATAEAIVAAERAAGNARMQGFVFQGRAYEGLAVNALEWVASHGGGTIVEADGTVSIDNPAAAEALQLAAGWIGTIAPEGVLNYAEEEARGVFQSGNAVFMRNWPYAWALAQDEDSPIRDAVGVRALPKGGPDGKHTGVLGGWQLAVSRYSAHPEQAIDLARWLTGHEEQKRRAVVGAYNPTIAALYEDEDVLAVNPFVGELYETFTNAVARPSQVTGQRYNQASAEFFGAVHGVLSGERDAATALSDLDTRLQRLARGGRW